ncbi:MAG: hypothetical protein MUO38_14455 [Anaerolineales bacterium]|nr:hypothetical protein [Anaerolineales bacterium]
MTRSCREREVVATTPWVGRLRVLASATLALGALTHCGQAANGGVGDPFPSAAAAQPTSSIASSRPLLRAGLRSSPYGNFPFPEPAWWLDSTASMASRFSGATPAVVWIVGEMLFPADCGLSFPSPAGTYPNIQFTPVDRNEAYLNAFDQAGLRVWLQVEPGDADVPTLIDLVLRRYGGHPSVVGLGIDVEWYQSGAYEEGRPVVDAEARAWSERVRSYNPDFVLFLKHWLIEKMPSSYRTGIVFVDDSQELGSLDAMVEEFAVWGEAFAPAEVGFQVGYEADQTWWSGLADPPGDIGRALLERIPNMTDLYWVDFTAYTLWPPR